MIDERVVPGQTEISNVMKHIARYNAILEFVQGKRVLDLACGSGYGSFLMAQVAESVVGLDLDVSAIDYATDNFVRNNLTFFVCDFYDALEHHGNFDVVVSLETIEHLPDLDQAEKMLGEIAPELIFSVPLNEPQGFNPYHFHTFTYDQALTIFPTFKRKSHAIQRSVNFLPPSPTTDQFVYYLAHCEKNS